MALSVTQPRTDRIAIRKTPGLMGGEACLGQTRIPVWGLVAYRRQGTSDEQLLEFYPSLTQGDLDAAWDYHRLHEREIDDAIQLHESG